MSSIARSLTSLSPRKLATPFAMLFAKPFVCVVAFLGLLSVGCGSSEVAESTPANSATKPAAEKTVGQPTVNQPTGIVSLDSMAIPPEPGVTPPTDIVSQFLDRVRRGGEDAEADALLTQKSRSEFASIGERIQAPGSPDARFEVTRAVSIPDEQNGAYVHSIWTEPGEAGEVTSTQVVWKLRKESNGWRINGMALEVAPDTAPLEIDFENGKEMARTIFANNTEPQTVQAPAGSNSPTNTNTNTNMNTPVNQAPPAVASQPQDAGGGFALPEGKF